jgi:DNA primase
MGNAIFLHTDSDGSVTGWEAKNQGFTGFSDGGQRLLYVARPDPDLPVSRIVITEAAIDALSYAQMYDVPGAIYVSTAGAAMSAEQKQQIVELVNSNESAEIVLASDNDEGGHKMAASIQALLPEVPMVRELSQTKDWNEDLKARAGDSGQNSTAKNVVSRP